MLLWPTIVVDLHFLWHTDYILISVTFRTQLRATRKNNISEETETVTGIFLFDVPVAYKTGCCFEDCIKDAYNIECCSVNMPVFYASAYISFPFVPLFFSFLFYPHPDFFLFCLYYNLCVCLSVSRTFHALRWTKLEIWFYQCIITKQHKVNVYKYSCIYQFKK